MQHCAQSLSHIQLFVTPWTAACQAPLTMEFSRQAYWNMLPFYMSGDLCGTGIACVSCTSRRVLCPHAAGAALDVELVRGNVWKKGRIEKENIKEAFYLL